MSLREFVEVLKVLGWTFLGLMIAFYTVLFLGIVFSVFKSIVATAQKKKTDKAFLKEMHICYYKELVEK